MGDAQILIQQVRAEIAKENYNGALSLLRSSGDRSGWTPQEEDEVRCLEEFLQNLNSPLII
jgi:hypothetical protein